MVNLKSKIYVAGHNGLVGSAIVRQLKKKGYKKIITANRCTLDLTNQTKVLKFLKKKKPQFIFIAAATYMAVGKVSLDDCDILTSSFGCMGSFDPMFPPEISMARFDITSLTFILV